MSRCTTKYRKLSSVWLLFERTFIPVNTFINTTTRCTELSTEWSEFQILNKKDVLPLILYPMIILMNFIASKFKALKIYALILV
jgi:hypothetical protein